MIQEISALTIVLAAFGYTVFSAIKVIMVQKKSVCGNACKCAFKKDLKSILLKNTKSLANHKFVDYKSMPFS